MEQTSFSVLHLDSNHPLLIAALHMQGFINDEDYQSAKDEIEEKISTYDGIVIRSRFKIDRQFIDRASNLKFIARVGAGLESIDTEYAESKGIVLIAAPEGNSNAVAEHALAMLLSLFNKLNNADAEVRMGQWNREANRGHELDGKTVGIIGYGNMGKAFAKKLRGFDVKVLCHDIKPLVGDHNAKQVPLETLYEQADVVSLHIPWTAETNGMVNSAFISHFKKPFWLINTSRGKNVVTAGLVQALQSGQVLGAGLDVLEYEKLSFEQLFIDGTPDAFTALLQMPNVMLTPHVAGWTFESHEKLAQVIAAKIIKLMKGITAEEEVTPAVTGIGGVFFKAKNSKVLVEWYGRNLGLKTDDYGSTFWWKDADGNDCSTQWSPFSENTKYFEPSQKQFMQNFRVNDLDRLLVKLKNDGVEMAGEPEVFEYGKFAWIIDPEGNKIELWEPVDKAFQ